MRRALLIGAIVFSAFACFAQSTADANLGKCSARFKVTDAEGSPLYNASVHLKIERHLLRLASSFTFGGIGWPDREVQVSTDSNGEARIGGLPESRKEALVFDVSKSRFMTLVVLAPESNCNPTFNVKLE